jgi:hypothetical protein
MGGATGKEDVEDILLVRSPVFAFADTQVLCQRNRPFSKLVLRLNINQPSVVGYVGSSAAVSLFADLAQENILKLAGLAAAYVVNALIDAVVADHAAKRECSISYILSLDE